MRTILFATCCLLLAGCLAPSRPVAATYPVRYEGDRGGDLVFVANGSGGTHALSDGLEYVASRTRTPLRVVPVDWSHGEGRVLSDHLNLANQRTYGAYLAQQVQAARQAYPGRRIYLAGHSSGCAVVLSAAESLPPDTLAGVVLLAPSTCAYHDLRPTLRASRGGVDVFFSPLDIWVLGFGIGLLGTTDRDCSLAAGRYGFAPVVHSPADTALYQQRLRQHAWDSSQAWTGHDGGHYGCLYPRFLLGYVWPVFGRPQ
jgi:pimeloyl-ACP methyl ester carboxylesterase